MLKVLVILINSNDCNDGNENTSSNDVDNHNRIVILMVMIQDHDYWRSSFILQVYNRSRQSSQPLEIDSYTKNHSIFWKVMIDT